jgi:hypothetical protein
MTAQEIEDRIREFEEQRRDPNCPAGTMPLHFACDRGMPEVVAELLARGADPNAVNVNALTPLNVVARGWGNAECAKLLLEAKADPNIPDTIAGMTPLHWAAAKANVEIVKLLLAHGANTRLKNSEGKTPLSIVETNNVYSASAEKRTIIESLKKAAPSPKPPATPTTPAVPASPEAGTTKRERRPLSRGKRIGLSIAASIVILLAALVGLNGVYLAGAKSSVNEKAHILKDIGLGQEEGYLLSQSVVFSADGASLITVHEKHGKGWLSRRWDPSSGKLLNSSESIQGYIKDSGYAPGKRSLPVSRSAIAPDLRSIAVGNEDNGGFTIHEAADSKLRSADGFILRYSDDGKSIAIGQAALGSKKDQRAHLVDLEASGKDRVLYSSAHPVSALEFSPDSSLLALCLYDVPNVYVFDRATGKRKIALGSFLARHTAMASAIAFSPDGKTLASGSYDRTVKFWDLGTGKLLATIAGHPDHIASLAYSADGSSLAALGGETIRLLKVPEAARQ